MPSWLCCCHASLCFEASARPRTASLKLLAYKLQDALRQHGCPCIHQHPPSHSMQPGFCSGSTTNARTRAAETFLYLKKDEKAIEFGAALGSESRRNMQRIQGRTNYNYNLLHAACTCTNDFPHYGPLVLQDFDGATRRLLSRLLNSHYATPPLCWRVLEC